MSSNPLRNKVVLEAFFDQLLKFAGMIAAPKAAIEAVTKAGKPDNKTFNAKDFVATTTPKMPATKQVPGPPKAKRPSVPKP